MSKLAARQAPLLGVALERELQRLLAVESFEPSAEFRAQALITDESVYEEAERDYEGWWARQAEELLDWIAPWHTVLDQSDAPNYRWFLGGRLNASYNCLDRHVLAGCGERVAYHWHGQLGEQRAVTYAELLHEVQALAAGLRARGIGAGDVVAIYMPMVPEVVAAMLACARIGAPHNVVFLGSSPQTLHQQLSYSEAVGLITVDGALQRDATRAVKQEIDPVLDELASLETVIVRRHREASCPMRPGRDLWWDEAVAAGGGSCPPESLDAEHPLFLLYTSGSTGKPKVVVHSTGGYLTGVHWTSKYVFDLKPESDVFWCTADAGWVTGHSYSTYGPLMNGVTSMMYEGPPDHPHRAIWWELVERSRVTVLYTAPTIIRSFISWGAELPAGYDLSSLRLLGTVGEPINPKAWLWYRTVIGGGRCPIVDTWWQTETGAMLIAPLPGVVATKPGAAGRPLPAILPEVLDDDGDPVLGEQGALVLRRPWPSMLRTLYKENERYRQTYFGRFDDRSYFGRFAEPAYYVGDAARVDADGHFWIEGRVDDVITVGSERLPSARIESAIVAHPKVAEAGVIGLRDRERGQIACAFVTLVGDTQGSPQLEQEIREVVLERLGEAAVPRRIVWAVDLAKTRSGKIMRRLLRNVAYGLDPGDVTTLRDPRVMDDLERSFAAVVATESPEPRPDPQPAK
ncbi:MAG: acetate--CoA ligase [Solirubrobacterales bacterium]|nr:acetate--CoA ligase [Solirubrobacterales bacterium]